jgi:Kef-type K+ transport system membrane component KefB
MVPLTMSRHELAAWMFLQLGLVLCVVRSVGFLARYIGQPRVVGEMIAGVLLGPSVFGLLFPELQSWLFPKETLSILYALSQLGLVLYMFIVGLDFDRALFAAHGRGAAVVSALGIAAPFLLGGCFVWGTFESGALFTPSVSLWQGALFAGAAMSITAFPMLARIIVERGLAGTSLGVLALSAGAADDAAAWCILALVIASFEGDPWIALKAIIGGIFYGLIVIKLLLPYLKQRESLLIVKLRSEGSLLAFALVLLALGAWFTDIVGIYAVFGAFLLGIAIPRRRMARRIRRHIEPLTTVLLLPLFFIYSGLNTKLALLLTPSTLFYALIAISLACIGKGVACAIGARWSGLSPRESCMVGALMNARGLMELILLNIGLERGLITPTLFAMMVMMAIVTTLLASPVFLALEAWTKASPSLSPEVLS